MNADDTGKQSMKGSLPTTRANVNNQKKKSFEFADVSTIAFICK